MNKKILFCVFFAAAILFLMYYHFGTVVSIDNIKYVQIAGQNIKVELALTDSEQEQGLSSRHSLKIDEGMLFVFSKPDKYAFWMKDMNFAIDIIWISEDMKVVYVKKDARPELYPETYGPDENAKYILEVVSGFAEKNNLKIGDTVQFIYRNL